MGQETSEKPPQVGTELCENTRLRKVIVITQICGLSITVPGVDHVVDARREKIVKIDGKAGKL